MSEPARPRVTLKLATSLDGRIAAPGGESKWITGEAARDAAHRLRAAHDAVLIGLGTARADNPSLTVRLDDHDGPQPARVVLDSRLRLHPDSALAESARQVPVIVFCADSAPGINASALKAKGVEVERAPTGPGGVSPERVLARLAERGFASVLVEGGGKVAASFLRAGAVDALEWFRAPILLGGDGVPAVGDLDLADIEGALRFRLEQSERLGEDVRERYVPA